MTLRELYLEKTQPLKVFRVESKTKIHWKTGDPYLYDVELWTDGKLLCHCYASKIGKKMCVHRNQVKQRLEKEFGSIKEAVEFYRQLQKNGNK